MRRLVLASAAAFALHIATTGCAAAEERAATPATFAATFSAAQAGDTIVLAGGDYGTFRGALKPGMVTIKPQPGAKATLAIEFDRASNITLDGLTFRDSVLEGTQTKNITIRNSTFDRSQILLRTNTITNANILFDNNTHANFVCRCVYEGRIQLAERSETEPSGVTIQNSLFVGGNSDGILNGANGTRILNNEFRDIYQQDDSSGVHADSIQLFGSKNTLIKGNFFNGVSVGIMCPDECDHETVEDNVFKVDESPFSMTWLSDNGSVIRHNTFWGTGKCSYNALCGVLYLGNQSQDPQSRGTIVKDNIIGRICVCLGTVDGLASEDFNLLQEKRGTGANDLFGKPAFVGGEAPGTYAGYALAAGSLGKGDASDGLDRGIRIAAAAAPSAPPAAGPAPVPAGVTVRARNNLRSILKTGRIRLAIRTGQAGPVTVKISVRPGRRSSTAPRGAHSRRVIAVPAVKLGQRAAGTHNVSIKLSRYARARLRRARDASLEARVTVGTRTTRVAGVKITR